MKSKIITSVRLLGSGHEHKKNNFKIVSNKLIIAALLVIGFSSFAQDQNPPDKKSNKGQRERMSPEQRSQARLDKLTTELNLDAKQQEQIKPIIEEQTAKREAMMDERMANRDSQKKMTARKDERTAMDNKLKAILTPEQFKKMKDVEEANMEKMREARESRQNRQDQE